MEGTPAAAQRRTAPAWARALFEHLAVVAGFAVATLWMTWPLATHLRTHIPDVGIYDPLLYARLLRHFLAWLSGSHPSLFEVDYFWPLPQALATTDVSLGILYGALPFLPFTQDLLTLVNLGVLVTFVLTGHATYLVARELTGSRAIGLFGGAAFTFCLFRLHQLDHLNILQMQWMGYALFGMLRLYARPTRLAAAGTTLAFFLHGSAGTNVALYSTFFFALVAGWMLLSVPDDRRRSFALHLGAAVVVAALALLPIYLPYLTLSAAHPLGWSEKIVDSYSGRPEQLYSAPPYNRLYGAALGKNLGRESFLFLGWTVLLLAAAGALFLRLKVKGAGPWTERQWWLAAADTAVPFALLPFALRDRTIAVVLVAFVLGRELMRWERGKSFDALSSFGLLLLGVALFYLFAGQGPRLQQDGVVLGEGLWGWLTWVPGFDSVRTPARLFFVVSFAAALLAALGLRELVALSKRPALKAALPLLALAGVLLEMNVSPLPLRRIIRIESANAAYRWLAEQPGNGAVLELPFESEFERYRMYHTTVHDRPTVAGEAGWRPPVAKWFEHERVMDGSAFERLRVLRASGLEYVLIDTRLLNPAHVGRYEELAAQSGASRVGAIASLLVWRYPPIEPKPLTREHAVAKVMLPASVALGAPVAVTVAFTPAGADHVFEHRTVRFTLELESGGERGRRKAYLSPPMLAPGILERQEVPVELALEAGTREIRYRLVDAEGRPWAEGTDTVNVQP